MELNLLLQQQNSTGKLWDDKRLMTMFG